VFGTSYENLDGAVVTQETLPPDSGDVLHPAEYEAVSGLLERRRRGQSVSVDQLLDDEDFDLLREERAADRDLAQGIVESWL
jgi:hypothetical protein